MAAGAAALQVDADRLRQHIMALAKSPRHSIHAAAGHRAAAEYISAVFTQAGLEVSHHVYDGSGRQGTNLIGLIEGSDPALPTILVTAHYDTVPESPGADDNASGVAALLEVARILGKASLRRNVELVAFDMEEVQPDGTSLVGSSAFVGSRDVVKRYGGVYNLEMVGFTSGPNTQNYPPGFGLIFPEVFRQVQERDFRGDFLAAVSQGGGIPLGQRLERIAHSWALELPILLIEASTSLTLLPDTFRGDHAVFWAAGVPAMMLTDTANFRNPNYHQPSDTPDTIDMKFLTGAAQSVVATVAEDADANFAA